MTKPKNLSAANLWSSLRKEVERAAADEPLMAGLFRSHILNHTGFGDALAFTLASRLGEDTPDAGLGRDELFALFTSCHAENSAIVGAAQKDILAVMDRDPATQHIREPLLFYKGFHALQTHRVAHHLWREGRHDMALYLQSQSSARFHVDIHPAAHFGHGIMLDHAIGLVIGSTARIGNDVSMLHDVTLGGTGKEEGDRHPKIGDGVMIGAGATILGNIKIGMGARIAAGAVVLSPVPPHRTAAGNPARIVGMAGCSKPGVVMDQTKGIEPEAPEMPAGRSRKMAGRRH
jgi:serine O-acetyltransferase